MGHRIFISHSCNERRSDDPEPLDPLVAQRRDYAREVRGALDQRLTAALGAGSVWYDSSSIRAGDDWEHEIIDALHSCAAAVILITPEALTSPWVLRESIVLVDRKLRNPDLVIVPIFLAGARPEHLGDDRAWNVSRITRIQGIQVVDSGADDVTSPAAADAADRAVETALPLLIAGVEAARAMDDLPRWARNLTGPLTELASGGLGFRLDEAAGEVGLHRPDRWNAAAITNLARALVIAPQELPATDDPKLLRAVLRLVDDAMAARADGPESMLCRQLTIAAAPAVRAVEILAATGKGAKGPVVIVLPPIDADQAFDDGFELELADVLLRRAHSPDLVVERHSGVGGEHPERLDPETRSAIRRMAHNNRGFARSRTPFVVLRIEAAAGVAFGDLGAQLAQAVTAEAPGAIVVLVTGGRGPVPEQGPAAAPSNVIALDDSDYEYAEVVYSSLTNMIPKDP